MIGSIIRVTHKIAQNIYFSHLRRKNLKQMMSYTLGIQSWQTLAEYKSEIS